MSILYLLISLSASAMLSLLPRINTAHEICLISVIATTLLIGVARAVIEMKIALRER